jgi:uncharacterized membrane protein YczE
MIDNASDDASRAPACAPRPRLGGGSARGGRGAPRRPPDPDWPCGPGAGPGQTGRVRTRALDLSTLSPRYSPAGRGARLLCGLVLYGVSMALMLRARLGLDPWDVLHQGLARRLGWSFGLVVGVVGVLVLLAWIPLRQRPGIGTVSNVVVVSVAVDLALRVLPAPGPLATRVAFLVGGVLLNAFATACYVGARLGPGPRDGLMTGLHARTGWSVRVVRTAVEVCVLATGWLLGGSVGAGTVLYAVAIGPLTQMFLPLLVYRRPGPAPPADPAMPDPGAPDAGSATTRPPAG